MSNAAPWSEEPLKELSDKHKAVLDLIAIGDLDIGRAYQAVYDPEGAKLKYWSYEDDPSGLRLSAKTCQENGSRLKAQPVARAYYTAALTKVLDGLVDVPRECKRILIKRLPIDLATAKAKELKPLHDIVRDLAGEVKKLELSGPNGAPLAVSAMSNEQLIELAALLTSLAKPSNPAP